MKRLKSWGVNADLPTAQFRAFKADEKQVNFGDVESQSTHAHFSAGWQNPGQRHTAQLLESLLESEFSELPTVIDGQSLSNATSGLVLTGDLLIPTCVRDSLLKKRSATIKGSIQRINATLSFYNGRTCGHHDHTFSRGFSK